MPRWKKRDVREEEVREKNRSGEKNLEMKQMVRKGWVER